MSNAKAHRARRLTLSAVALTALAAALTSGCAARSTYMQPLSAASATTPASATQPTSATPPFEAPPGRALVVILRPSRMASMVRFSLCDDEGRFLGEAVAGSYHTVELEPGEHMLYAWTNRVTAMHASVEAGRVYYVLAQPSGGFWMAGVALAPFTPRHRHWDRLSSWLERSQPMRADLAAGQAHFDENREWLQGKIERGRQAWQSLPAERRTELTLGPNDGAS